MQASSAFSQEIHQHGVVVHLLGQELLQSPALLLARAQARRPMRRHPAELGLLLVDDRLADPVLPTEVRRLNASLVLSQHADDLLFTERAAPHGLTPNEGTKLINGHVNFCCEAP